MPIQLNPVSGKPDINTPVTSTDHDEVPGSLAEREARSYRPDPSWHRGTARAVSVIGSDGLMGTMNTNQLLMQLIYEVRAMRLGQILQGACLPVQDVDDIGGF